MLENVIVDVRGSAAPGGPQEDIAWWDVTVHGAVKLQTSVGHIRLMAAMALDVGVGAAAADTAAALGGVWHLGMTPGVEHGVVPAVFGRETTITAGRRCRLTPPSG